METTLETNKIEMESTIKPQSLYKRTYRKIGRIQKYHRASEIETKYLQYKKECKDKGKLLTKAGLLLKLEISRPLYARYKLKKAFHNIIRTIELEIEDEWIQKLNGKQSTGPIFYLKNAFSEDYRDRTELDQIVRNPKPITDIIKTPKDAARLERMK